MVAATEWQPAWAPLILFCHFVVLHSLCHFNKIVPHWHNYATVTCPAEQAHKARMQALEASAGTLFAAIFALLGRLEEIESKVRLLQLVSICVEVLGEAAQPHLGAVAAALPQVRRHTRPSTRISCNHSVAIVCQQG